MAASSMMNLGSQLIGLTFLARHQKTTAAATWQSTMRDMITVPVFLIMATIYISLKASAYYLSWSLWLSLSVII